MEKLIYPMKTMGITQNYNGKTSHYIESHATPPAYPIDDAGKDTGRDDFYMPCTAKIVRIYGVGDKRDVGVNTIWFESVDKVELANGKSSYVVIRVTHPEDEDLKKLKVGQILKQGEKAFKEGKDGNATGNHVHISVHTCKWSQIYSKGWYKNSNGVYVTVPYSIKPEEAFYVDKTFTTIKNNGGLNFKNLPSTSKTKKLYLPASATSWRVYKIGVKPIVGNECGFLKPSKFGGLTYDILGYSTSNVAIIQTRDFGKVQIYVAASTGAVIK